MVSPTKSRQSSLPIKLYHHGIYSLGRGVEVIIEAVKELVGRYELHLRLLGDTADLKSVYKDCQNIIFHDPLPVTGMIKGSAEFDVGVSMIKPSNMNNIYSLSNKFFEYLYAGLPLLVHKGNVTMTRYVEEYDLGFVCEEYTPEAIRKTLSLITPEKIDEKKANVIKRRTEFSAEKDWGKMLRILEHKSETGNEKK